MLGRRHALLALGAAAFVQACGGCGKTSRGDDPASLDVGDGAPAGEAGADTGIRMRTWRPKAQAKRVGILLLHGAAGPNIFTDEGSDHRAYPEAFAQAGYAVFMPYYTHGGEPFTLGKGGFTLVSKNPEIDKVVVVGFSRGASVGLKLAAEEPKIAALVALYGFMTDVDAKKVKRMPPTFILHGVKDEDVKVEEAHKLDKLFKQKKIDHEMFFYPDQGHGFSEPAIGDSIRRIVDFLDRKAAGPPTRDAGRG